MIHPGSEIRVKSWSDLANAFRDPRLVHRRAEYGDHLRSSYVFRGMDNTTWGLETSIQRPPVTPLGSQPDPVVERALVRSFRKFANAGAFDRQSEWYVLAVGQHNGLPTRCLDWTTSPMVAAHFACADFDQRLEDGVIWCLHAGCLNDINESNNPQLASLKGIAWVYDTKLLTASFRGLDRLDQSAANGELLLLWEPPSLDARIANQSGLLSLLNSGGGSHEDFLTRHSMSYPDLVLRIVIDKAAKPEIRDMLDQNNVSERSLFPGLPGLCAWMKRYYGKAW